MGVMADKELRLCDARVNKTQMSPRNDLIQSQIEELFFVHFISNCVNGRLTKRVQVV